MTEQQPENDPLRGSSPPPTPAWVKALGVAAALVVLLVLVAALFGGASGHGPGMHGG